MNENTTKTSKLLTQKKNPNHQGRGLLFGGEGGIRTLDTLPYTHFPGVLLQPLGHLTKFLLLEVAFGARCACILPTSSVGSLSDTAPNFCLWFNVFSQHDVRCAVALERGVI